MHEPVMEKQLSSIRRGSPNQIRDCCWLRWWSSHERKNSKEANRFDRPLSVHVPHLLTIEWSSRSANGRRQDWYGLVLSKECDRLWITILHDDARSSSRYTRTRRIKCGGALRLNTSTYAERWATADNHFVILFHSDTIAFRHRNELDFSGHVHWLLRGKIGHSRTESMSFQDDGERHNVKRLIWQTAKKTGRVQIPPIESLGRGSHWLESTKHKQRKHTKRADCLSHKGCTKTGNFENPSSWSDFKCSQFYLIIIALIHWNRRMVVRRARTKNWSQTHVLDSDENLFEIHYTRDDHPESDAVGVQSQSLHMSVFHFELNRKSAGTKVVARVENNGIHS